ncbi:MAG: lactonase family protein [Spirochaetales bacterium]|nr:lactonase family protein [Spirochaetales bacterium]
MGYFTYITLAGENKIALYAMDPDTGALTFKNDIGLSGGPGPIAVDKGQEFMHIGIRSICEIASFRIDQNTGGLTALGTIGLDADPCYMFVDRTGKFLLSSYYRAGKVTVHSIGADGAAGEKVAEVPTAEHAHCVQTDRANRFAFVPHTVPPNAIFQFLFDADKGMLTPNASSKVTRPAGEGPRHFVFHPVNDFVYVSNENSSSVTAYRFDAVHGTLADFQTLSTLPGGFAGENTCAQIHMTPCGRMLFVSNRGHDSIAHYAIDANTGCMTPLGRQKTEPVPRVFAIDPTGRFLFAAGQGSGKMETFRIDLDAGSLKSLGVRDIGIRPMWVTVLRLDG